MLHLARVVIVGLLSISSLAQPVLQTVSLEMGGVTVWLGMPRQEVVDRCASAGLKQMTADRNSILLKKWWRFLQRAIQEWPATPVQPVRKTSK